MRGWHALTLASLLALTASCRGLPLAQFTPPPPTEPPVPVQQLVFRCDFELPPDHRLVRELIAERDDIYTTLSLPPSAEKITVFCYHDSETYHEMLARKFPMVPTRRAFFVETDTRLEVYAHWSDRVAEDLRHEVAHGYLHASVPAIPLWVDEGLAEYFEVPRGFGGLNRPHVMLLADLIEHNGWKPNLLQLESLNEAGQMGQEHYAESWAWVYFLLNSTPENRETLTKYLADLRATGRTAPLSTRLAERLVQPERALREYLVTLRSQQPAK